MSDNMKPKQQPAKKPQTATLRARPQSAKGGAAVPSPQPTAAPLNPVRPSTAVRRNAPTVRSLMPARRSLKPSSVPFSPAQRYNDDQEIAVKVVEERKDAAGTEDRLQVSMKCALGAVQPTTTPQEVPCMVSLTGVCKDFEEIERSRPGLDLVCVIDISGSMNGEKIELVKETLKFLVTKLTASDRMSLVIFDSAAYRVCPLWAVSPEGRTRLERCIGLLAAEDSTNIVGGLECGLSVLAHRRIVNTVSSLFLLSDGVDDNRTTALARSQAVLSRYRSQIRGDFTVHTFGFGADHDSNIMCNVADQGCGEFHFVEKLESIAEAFADSFGGLVSQVAKNVEIRLQVVPAPVPCRITKVYTKSGEDFFSLPAVMANESKDFVFILEVGAGESLAAQTCPVVVAEVRYSSVTGQATSERAELSIDFAATGEQLTLDVHREVLVNFYRVKGAEILKEATALAERGQYDLSRQCLETGLTELQGSLVATDELVATLIRDLQDAKDRVRDDGAWHRGGAAQLKSVCSNHYKQVASSNAKCYSKPQQVAYSMQFQAYKSKKS